MALPGFELIWYVRAVEVFSLVIAFVLAMFAYRGYKKTRARGFLLAALGFTVLGAASLIEGFLFEVVGLSLDDVHAFRSTLTAAGLVILLYSIYRAR